MKSINTFEAEKLLREVFLTKEIKEALQVTEEQVKNEVTAEMIAQIQQERFENLPKVQALKEEIKARFPYYRFSARLKSLPSIFGKTLKHRTAADVFGIKVMTKTIKDCYYFKKWLVKNFDIFDFDDRIRNPKPNGYRDLKIVVHYQGFLVEFIIQTHEMYIDAHSIQAHELVYPWKYHDVIKNLPAEYETLKF